MNATCPKCGREVPASAWSCPHCGSSLSHQQNYTQTTQPKKKNEPAVDFSKLWESIVEKLPSPLQNLLTKCSESWLGRLFARIPKSLKIGTFLLMIIAGAGTVYAITANETALKTQTNEFVQAKNMILLGSPDTQAINIIGKNVHPEKKREYIADLLAKGERTQQKQGDLYKTLKVSSTLQTIEIAEDKTHAEAVYLITISTDLDNTLTPAQVPLRNGILRMHWTKENGTWYFDGEDVD